MNLQRPRQKFNTVNAAKRPPATITYTCVTSIAHGKCKEGGACERGNKGSEGVATNLAGGLGVAIVSRCRHERGRPNLPVQQENHSWPPSSKTQKLAVAIIQDFAIKKVVQICLLNKKTIMAPPSKRQKTAEDREQETFRKRSNGVMKKIHELSIFTNTDLYLVMLREGKFKTYSSVERDGWPPSQSDIVSTWDTFL